jgi:hypothetical protein
VAYVVTAAVMATNATKADVQMLNWKDVDLDLSKIEL